MAQRDKGKENKKMKCGCAGCLYPGKPHTLQPVTELATPGKIVGRVVGETRRYVAVAVIETPAEGNGCGVLLAVRTDGTEYVTCRFGPNMAEDGISTWNWKLFPCAGPSAEAHYQAFSRAEGDLKSRAVGMV